MKTLPDFRRGLGNRERLPYLKNSTDKPATDFPSF